MPTFTRAVLAPVLDDFVPRCPEVRLHIVEGYSGLLTEMVLDEELDFAVVPAFEGTIGLKSRLLVRDREMLISGPKRGFAPLAPLRLAECKPLKFVVPGPDNIRRRNLETYFQSHGVEVEAMLEMDAMIATLEFVARSDWVTILPSVISVNDIGRGELIVNPIVAPELHAEFVVIQPTRRTLTDAGAPVPATLRSRSRAYSRGVGRGDRGAEEDKTACVTVSSCPASCRASTPFFIPRRGCADECPLTGVKQISRLDGVMSAFDPERTLAVRRGSGFDAGFSPYQSTRLNRYDAVS